MDLLPQLPLAPQAPCAWDLLESESQATDIRIELEADARRELAQLSDISFAFLSASAGNVREAEELLDTFINLLFEGGAFSSWRYKILLSQVREGL